MARGEDTSRHPGRQVGRDLIHPPMSVDRVHDPLNEYDLSNPPKAGTETDMEYRHNPDNGPVNAITARLQLRRFHEQYPNGRTDFSRDSKRKVDRMRNFGWVGPPTDNTTDNTTGFANVSDNPANRKVRIGSTPDPKTDYSGLWRTQGHSPVVEFPEGNENGVKIITGTTNHKTKMGARRAAKRMVKDNSEYLLNTKGGVPKTDGTEDRASKDTLW